MLGSSDIWFRATCGASKHEHEALRIQDSRGLKQAPMLFELLAAPWNL